MTPSIDAMTEAAIDGILKREGGYVDRPEDRGGPTNRGITAATLGTWRHLGRNATPEEVRSSTEDEARAIYRFEYTQQSGATLFTDPGIFELIVDSAVQHGPKQAVRFIQRSLGLKDDGVVGPITARAIYAAQSESGASGLYWSILGQRIRFLGRWITDDTTDADRDGVTDTAELAAGLLARMADFVEARTSQGKG